MSVRGREEERENEEIKGEVSHIVGAQRDPPSTASAEFGLAVRAEVTTAVSELGLAANTAGGRIILLLRLLTSCLCSNATHLLFVTLKLLVQCSARRREKKVESCPLAVHPAHTNLLYFSKHNPPAPTKLEKQFSISDYTNLQETESKVMHIHV